MWYFAAGDAGFYFKESLKELSFFPVIWHSEYGFGLSTLSRLWFDYPYEVFIKILSLIGLSWWVIDKILWIIVFGLGLFSSYKISSYIIKKSGAAIVSSIIYCTNTYILLLFGGGQIGVALAYAFAPFVLSKFLELLDEQGFIAVKRRLMVLGVLLAILISFDLRIAFLTFIAAVLYSLLFSIKFRIQSLSTIKTLLYPTVIALILHSYWIFPTLFVPGKEAILKDEYINPGILNFLSFSDFSHALGLLHPNWPENIFGKIYFLQPEFLFFPLLAFLSLLFLRKLREKKHIYYLVLLSILGAFFAKGINEPFGELYQFAFEYIPGFVMFRDPTKFYIYLAIGYSVLIPFALSNIATKFSFTQKRYYTNITVYLFFLLLWLFSVRHAITGQLNGNFRPLEMRQEYIDLKNELVKDVFPSRVLWLPQSDKFVYASKVHPLLTFKDFNHKSLQLENVDYISRPAFKEQLEASGIGYVVVQADLEKKIFLDNYIFTPKLRNDIIESLNNTNLIRDAKYKELAVYRNPNFTYNDDIPSQVISQSELTRLGLIISISFLFLISFMIYKSYSRVK